MTDGQAAMNGFCFHGSYERAVDAKGRFNLPFRFRQGGPVEGPERYVASDGPDGTLNLLPYDEFIAAFNKARRREPGAQQRADPRRLSATSHVVEADAQGRVALGPDVLKRFGIEKRVLVVGMGNYMELWDPDGFAAGQAEAAAPGPDFLDEFYG